MKTNDQHIADLFEIITVRFADIRTRAHSVIRNRDNGRWEVVAMIDQNPGWKDGRLADFDNAADACKLKNMLQIARGN